MTIRPQRSARRLAASAAALVLLLSVAPRARAQTTTPDRVAAESLFAEGRQLLAAGDYAQACAKLEASRRLEGALGTSLNLAACYERLGRTASAWAEFKSAAAEAQKTGDTLRKTEAIERAGALEPRLSRLRLEVDEPAARVLWNGVPLSSAFIGSAIPVDPGAHRFEATAPGKLPWSRTLEIAPSAPLVELRVPSLEDAPAPAASTSAAPAPAASTSAARAPDLAAPAEPAPARSPLSETPPMTRPSGGRHGALPWALAGAGAAAVGTGAVFGALAASSWSRAEDSCADYPYGCAPEGLEHAGQARARATVATVAVLLGGAAVATSVVLFVVDSDDPESTELALTPAGVQLRGAF